MATQSNEIQARGIVVILQGNAWIEDKNGNRRPLKVGDELEEGQKIITAEGTRLELALPNGLPLFVEAGRELIIDTSLLGTAPQDKTQAALESLNGGATDIAKVIASGGDLTEQLEATAAGLGGGQGSEAHSFVRLARISENLNDLELTRAISQPSNEELPVGNTTQPTNASEGVPTVSIPNDGTGVGGSDTSVAENASTTGTFTISAPDGLTSLTVGSSVITAAALAAATSGAPVTIAGSNGTLSITGYNSSTGVVSYSYDPTGTSTNHSAGNVIEHFSVTVTDPQNDTATSSLDVLITDSTPVAVADAAAITEDAAPNTVSGSVLTNDTVGADANANAVTAATVTLTYGSLVLNSNGTYTYTLNNANPTVNALNVGQTLTDSYTYTITDGDGDTTTATLSITINGSNDAPVAVANTATAVEAGGTSNATAGTNPTGNVLTNDTDVDTGDTKTVSSVTGTAAGTVGGSTSGNYGTLVLNANGSYTYTVNNNLTAVQALRTSANTLTDTFSYTVRDAAGLTSTTTLTVTIQGADDAPVATVDTGAVNENATLNVAAATGVLANDTDVDSGDTKTVSAVSFGATPGTVGSAITGTYGTLTLNADGSYSYSANTTAANALAAGATANDVFTYTVRDTAGLTSNATLTITVTGTNDAPVAISGAASGTEDTALTLTWANFGISDVDTASSGLSIKIASLPVDGVLQYSADGVTWTAVTVNQLITKADVDAGHLRFMPDANESGSNDYATVGTGNMKSDYASFTYQASDGSLTSTTATLTVDIRPVTDDALLKVGGVSVIDGSTTVVTQPAGNGLTVRTYTAIANIDTTTVDTVTEVQQLLNLLDADTPDTTTISTAPQNYTDPGNGDAPSGIPTDGAYRMTGLIYLEAGHTYTFSSYMDDTALLVLGGTIILEKNYNSWGNITATTYTPTVNGYYTLDWAVYNGNRVGAIKPSLSVDGGTPLDLTSSNFKIYSSISSVENAGGIHDAVVGTPTAGYYPISNSGVEDTVIKISPITTALADTDGSESLVSLVVKNLLVGTVLSDGTHTFTATAGSTSVDITSWSLNTLTMQAPGNFNGTYGLTFELTSKENATNELATTTTTLSIPVTAVNDAPVAVADTNSVTEDSGVYTVTGSVTSNDTDIDGDALTVTAVSGQSALTGTSVLGSYGSFVINANGTYSYALTSDDARVNALNSGQTLTDAISYTVSDPSGATSTSTLTVTINGATDAYAVSSSITGTAGADTLTGTGVDDRISALSGNDYVEAGAGNDVVYAGDGGSGTTVANLKNSTFMTTVDTSMTSGGVLTSSVASTTNKGYGDLVHGGAGNDALFGEAGSDLLYGGTGNDYLNGGTGNDALRGGAGNDRLEGGQGSDVLKGDTGADVFAWSLNDGAASSGVTAAGGGNAYGVGNAIGLSSTTDLVMDFSKTQGDVLDLRDLLAGENHQGLATGNLSNYLHFEVSNSNTVVHVSTSGGFTNGVYNSANENQTIVLTGVNLLQDNNGVTLLNDNAVIQDLLNNKRLIVD